MTNPMYKRKRNIKFPSRNRGRSQHYLLGGIHMTSYGYLPFALLKLITCTECDEFHDIPNKLEKASKGGYFGNGWRHFEQQQQLIVPKHNRPSKSKNSDSDRIVLLKDALQKDGSLQSTYYIPWFLKCNPKRYPSWFDPFQSDPRIA